jgi:dTDP-4-amino-4,6-dideoxygalactose transaminase
MSNVVAGVVRGQYPHLCEHIAQKKAIYERYREAFSDLPVRMNPIVEGTEPNYWLTCLTVDEEFMCRQERDDTTSRYVKEPGKSCPTEILEAIAAVNAEGRPIWKPMHMQPLYRAHGFVTREGDGPDVGADIFARGLCLPSDNKMTKEEQDVIIRAVRACFD